MQAGPFLRVWHSEGRASWYNCYNKSQRDALLLNFILVKNSICFGQTDRLTVHHQESILYSQQLVFVNITIGQIPITINTVLRNLTFRGPCIVNIFQYISNRMQRYTPYLCLQTARHVSGGTSTHHQEHINCIYSIWNFSNRYCYLQLSWKSWNSTSNSSTIASDKSSGLTSNRCCRYSCMCSWWWVEIPSETWRAVSRYK